MDSKELEKISGLYFELGNMRQALKKLGYSDSHIYKKSKELLQNDEFTAILEKDAKTYIDGNIAGVLRVLTDIIYNTETAEKTRLTAIQTFLDRSRLHKTEKTEIEVINSPTEIISELYEQIKQRKQPQVIEATEYKDISKDKFIENLRQSEGNKND